MRMQSPEEFLHQAVGTLVRSATETPDLSRYEGTAYCCACGRAHRLSVASVCVHETDSEQSRVLVACPELGAQAMTIVQLRNGVRARAFSESGCRLETDEAMLDWLEQANTVATDLDSTTDVDPDTESDSPADAATTSQQVA